MSWVQYILRNRFNLLQLWEEMWNLSGVQRSSSRTTTTSPQITGYVAKKNSSRGAKHEPSERQKVYYQAKQKLSKARQGGKHGCHPAILSRWYGDEEYRKSLSAIGWKEHHIMLYDRIGVEKHIYIATRAERIQNSKHWILTNSAEGLSNQSISQRPDFAQAKRESKRLHDEHLARTQEEYRTIPRSQQERQRKEQHFKGKEEYELETKKELVCEDAFWRIRESDESWTLMFAVAMIGTVSKLKFHLCLRTIPPLGLESWMVLISTLQKSMLTKKEEDIASGKQDQDRSPQ